MKPSDQFERQIVRAFINDQIPEEKARKSALKKVRKMVTEINADIVENCKETGEPKSPEIFLATARRFIHNWVRRRLQSLYATAESEQRNWIIPSSHKRYSRFMKQTQKRVHGLKRFISCKRQKRNGESMGSIYAKWNCIEKRSWSVGTELILGAETWIIADITNDCDVILKKGEARQKAQNPLLMGRFSTMPIPTPFKRAVSSFTEPPRQPELNSMSN